MITKLAKKAAVKDKGADVALLSASMRLDKDFANLDGTTASVTLPDPNNKLLIHVTVKPKDGIWSGGTFEFRVSVPSSYPHEPPKVAYLGPHRIWHPNIEGDADRTEWGVCLNILRKDWTPVLGLRDIVFGLEMMFFEPNLEDPLPGTARQAAQQMKDAPREFERKAKSWMRGQYV